MAVIVKDGFNRANSASTMGVAETGQAWTALGSTWGIDNNQARNYAGEDGIVVVNTSVSDCIVTVRPVNKIDGSGIVIRQAAGTSGNCLQIQMEGNTIIIFERPRWAVLAEIATVPHSILKVVAQGNSIKVFLDNVEKASIVTNYNINEKRHGLGTWKVGATFDDFLIEDFGTAPVEKTGSAILKGAGKLTTAGKKEKHSGTSLKGSGKLTVSGTKIKNASAILSGKGHLTTSQVVIRNGQATLKGVGRLTASAGGTPITTGSANLLGRGSLSAKGQKVVSGGASLLGKGIISSLGIREVLASATMLGKGTLRVTHAGNVVIITSGAKLTGLGSLTAKGRKVIVTAADIKRLKGKRILYVYLAASRSMGVNLKAKRELFIHLKGGVRMTMVNQNFNMYAGNSKFIVFEIDGASDLSGATLKWGIRKEKDSDKNVLIKATGDGISTTGNEVKITLGREDTQNLSGAFHQECFMVDADGLESTVLTGMAVFTKRGLR